MGHRPYPNLERARRRARRSRRLSVVKAPQVQVHITPPSDDAVAEIGRSFQRAFRRGMRSA